jgi:hypothetical protein
MIITVPLYPGTVLGNVRYTWIAAGVEGPELSAGITQPDIEHPIFRLSVTPPVDAEEIIVYDVTDEANNWNVGQYRVAALATPSPGLPILIPAPAFGAVGLRTVTYRSVYEAILRRHGLDPVAHAITHDPLRALTQHVNTRIKYAWRYWRWPQLELLQNRAYRTTWTNTLQFLKVNAEGVPDELYYATNSLYYRVKSGAPADPPIGTLPTDTTYFETFTLTDRYILLDQVNQTPIGEVVAIYNSDPRLTTRHCACQLPFSPTEREVTVTECGTGATVWVQFRIPPSEFTGIPFVTGKTYALGERIYHPADGECYRAIIAGPTGDPTAQPAQWLKIPLPAIFASYVEASAYAAGLRETPTDPAQAQIRMAHSQLIEKEAEMYLTQECDRLIAQGQVYHYGGMRAA